MSVQRLHPADSRWPEFVDHLRRMNMARWVLDAQNHLKPDLYCLAALADDQIAGHLTMKRQPLVTPATAWSGNRSTALTGPDGSPLLEMFVLTFGVEEALRRRGFGRALQLAAIELARGEGCYQLRSWSSQDKPANYALKISLGFAVHPAIETTLDGTKISGVYFVRTV
ncbi:MAG: hypothetical protein Kow0077_01530 [Anaerolineae bacterium]